MRPSRRTLRRQAELLSCRIRAQFDRMSKAYFTGFDFDLGERELGYALSFDHDLDMFVASLGLVKTSTGAAMKRGGKSRSQQWRVLVLMPAVPSFTRRGFGYG